MGRPTSWRTDHAEGVRLVNLAKTWIEDGALISGADCLREAADKFEAAQLKRNAAIEKSAA